MKPSVEPSGDQAGDMLDCLELVSCRVAPERVSASQISVSYALSSQFVSRTVYAINRPSAEISGDAARFSERMPSTSGAPGAAETVASAAAATNEQVPISNVRIKSPASIR